MQFYSLICRLRIVIQISREYIIAPEIGFVQIYLQNTFNIGFFNHRS